MKKTILVLTMLVVSCSLAFAQEHRVSGKVTDASNDPLPGITVQVQGTNTGTATDADGEYELSVPSAKATLIFRGIGFTQQEVEVNDRSTVNATLESSTAKLNELVVTALGIQRASRELGYSTKEVNSKDLTESRPVTIGEGLTGKVSGLQINTINNGVDPGIRVVLRGYRHLNADNQALIVLDGVPVRSDLLSSINPNDVASVTVLKGASAAALYGVDATNGVLIITTKRGGKGGKPKIEFNNTTMFERVSYMPKLQTKFSPNGGETGAFPWDPTQNYRNPYTGDYLYVPYENQNYGMPFNGDPNLGYIGGPLADSTFFKTPFKAVSPDPRRAFFQTGYRIQNNLSYSGGDNENSYFISVQDVSTKGVVPKDQARRTSLYVSGKKTFGIFSAQFNLSYSQNYSNTAGNDFYQGRPVYWNLLNQGANVPLEDPRLKDPNSPYFLENYYNAYYPNPWWQIYNSREINRSNNFAGVLTLNLQATDWLNLTYRAATQFSDYYNSGTIAAVNFSPYAVSDPWSASNIPSQLGAHQNGMATYTNANARSINQDIMATFHKKVGDFDGTLILGNSINEKPYANNYSSYTTVGSKDLFIDNFYNTNYRIGELNGATDVDYNIDKSQQGVNKTRMISGYGDLTLGYKNYLFLHGNFRRDWTSLLPKGKNAYNFWAVDASWVFTDAIASLKSQNFLTYGKLRAAYSHTGDITLAPYHIQNVFDVGTGYPYGGQAGLSLDDTYNNPDLVPELTIEKEVGIELGFWNDRINFTAEYYHDNTTGQTFPVNVSYATGYGSAYVNAGNVMTSGLELSTNVTAVQNNANGLKWDIGVNFTINNSKVISMYQGVGDFLIQTGSYFYDIPAGIHAVKGRPFPVIETDGLKRDPQGRVIIDPTTGYAQLTDTQAVRGQVNPKYLLNINTRLSWKNFSLYLQASYRAGNVFFAYVGDQLNFTGTSAFTTQNGRQRFIFPNSVYEENGKYIPNDKYYVADGNATFWTNEQYAAAGTTYIENAAFWKLRNISLSYDFQSLIPNIHWMTGLTFTIMAKNLLMLRPSQNVWTDPEFNYNSGNEQGFTDYQQLPPTRQFGFSLDVKF
ncbi:MAG TPA: SusC/RagA family TonB-linked outer membrane protein [Chitinophagaceae bacterium]|nr:SusC/RagA family TonB-linked outer membrane protein [Chitinophagaceae bacterium]